MSEEKQEPEKQMVEAFWFVGGQVGTVRETYDLNDPNQREAFRLNRQLYPVQIVPIAA